MTRDPRMEICDPRIGRYAWDHTSSDSELLQELAEATHAEMDDPQMLTGRVEGQLLRVLIQSLGARRVLEIGTFTGYSALSMAAGLADDGELITCEADPQRAAFARRYFDRSPHGNKIRLRIGPALDTLGSLAGPFDLVFVDADKENYPAYYRAVLPLLRSGGLLVIDNALWSGAVLDPVEATDKAIAEVNRMAQADDQVDNVLLTVRDGIHIVRKR